MAYNDYEKEMIEKARGKFEKLDELQEDELMEYLEEYDILISNSENPKQTFEDLGFGLFGYDYCECLEMVEDMRQHSYDWAHYNEDKIDSRYF